MRGRERERERRNQERKRERAISVNRCQLHARSHSVHEKLFLLQ